MIQGEMSVRTAGSEIHHQHVHAEVDSPIAKANFTPPRRISVLAGWYGTLYWNCLSWVEDALPYMMQEHLQPHKICMCKFFLLCGSPSLHLEKINVHFTPQKRHLLGWSPMVCRKGMGLSWSHWLSPSIRCGEAEWTLFLVKEMIQTNLYIPKVQPGLQQHGGPNVSTAPVAISLPLMAS